MAEIWDIYDENRKYTGKKVKRGLPLEEGDYHLVVHIWIKNSEGKYLIQKRAKTVESSPDIWATTGGSVISGETTEQAFSREMKEEIGIEANKSASKIVKSYRTTNAFVDVWLVHQDFNTSQCELQKEEVSAVKWVTYEEISELIAEGDFHYYSYIEELREL